MIMNKMYFIVNAGACIYLVGQTEHLIKTAQTE